MSDQSRPQLPPKIYAEAVVRSTSGESLLRSSQLITRENVCLFHAASDQSLLVADQLRAAGFDVLDIGAASINIAAAPEVYRHSLGANLEVIERPIMRERGQHGMAEFINSADPAPLGEIDVSNTDWKHILDGVAINEPAYFLQKCISGIPPQTNTRYLQVPDDLATELGAKLAHDQGITGKGVKVVVVDSGCYAEHPFFKHHNYHLDVVLGPGSSNPTEDTNGHGTGVAANVLAIAPDAHLTVLKSDVALGNKTRNINSAAAFRKAVSLRPDIISCSWGSDLRSPYQLSSSHKVLAAAIADAVRQGIVVVFAAGNGQWGFPSQHPDVIAVGGVYKHLEGSLKGRVEASNYASSFISTIYPGRRVPDVCGLVGRLPNAAYIMLPVPPGSTTDHGRAAMADETEATDGWAAFSGTSSAAPQLAGACALLEEFVPGLDPLKTKQILQETASDIVEGSSNPTTGGGQARDGPDLATGYGLAAAYKAVQAAQKLVPIMQETNNSAPFISELSIVYRNKNGSVQNKKTPLKRQRRNYMKSNLPKLEAKLEYLLWKFQKQIQEENSKENIEDVELLLSAASFKLRSPVGKVIYALRESLDSCFHAGNIMPNNIKLEHVSAAQGLLKLGRYQETAIKVLTKALQNSISNDEERSKIVNSAMEALSNCGAEIKFFDGDSESENMLLFSEIVVDGKQCRCADITYNPATERTEATGCKGSSQKYYKVSAHDPWTPF